MLSILNLTRKFSDHTAVSNFQLEMTQGEFVTLLGPSGSGKSTVLRMVAGLLEPTAGSIVIDGQDVTRLPAKKRNIGFVFQSYALFPHLTAFENVAFPLRVRKWSKQEVTRRVEELLDLVGLRARAQYHPALLSGGERQRIALARALAFHPPLLLLDEPLSALDAQVRVSLRQFLKEIQRTTGVTTLMVTHDQEEALALADRIVVMSAGKVEQVGTPYEVYNEPKTSFTAQFIGNVSSLVGRILETKVVSQGQGNPASDLIEASVAGSDAHWARLQWAGGTFEWLFQEPVAVGAEHTVFVRPEAVDVSLSEFPGTAPAVVTHVSFMGALTRLTLQVAGELLLADIHSHRYLGITVGNKVYVRITDPRLHRLEEVQEKELDASHGSLLKSAWS